ncbi:unnamed protein product [Eruca vesicaria subsp. sativa]|uniref:Protein kinase domain-containing protein n=1 Tax=Eruca vesicaria subsp. sativa TaxID=29727 RepID=A0ABC8JPC2_ERUVS|nr:unnamed protein product [Eruca vesicaria subsp. sativa]
MTNGVLVSNLFRTLRSSFKRPFLWISFFLALVNASLEDVGPDYEAMEALSASLKLPDDIDWGSSDYCTWTELDCDKNGRVTSIRLCDRGISGSLPPELKNLSALRVFEIKGNQIAGIIPKGFTELQSLRRVSLSSNLLQGPTPKFRSMVDVDMRRGTNRFCVDSPGSGCDPIVDALLSIAGGFNYPLEFAKSWKGNNPCHQWFGISCEKGRILAIIMPSRQLTGTISPRLGDLTSVLVIDLSHNYLTGMIPVELTKLKKLRILDLSHNQLHGKVPHFRRTGILEIQGNPELETNIIHHLRRRKTKIIVGGVIGSLAVVLLVVAGYIVYLIYIRKKDLVQSPDHNEIEIVEHNEIEIVEHNEIEIVEHNDFVENKVIPIQTLRDATNNFRVDHLLGEGGFGSVYRGTLQDGRDIAVKKMNTSGTATKGISEFKSEVTFLTRVHHRNLVTLYGYSIEGNERLLVYQYMPQGTLSKHLFHWSDHGLSPLEWTTRLNVALDVARGVEYLHTLDLESQNYIHRDLKPSNILLGDDLRAKVSDFGLVVSTTEGRESVRTKCVGTPGYIAPEYRNEGWVTRKIDVYSFGVILMELITGKKALDHSLSQDDIHITTWFRKMLREEDTFLKAIDGEIIANQETQRTIYEVAKLARQCCTRTPEQRPDMSQVVSFLSSLIERWEPSSDIQDFGENTISTDLISEWEMLMMGSTSAV